MAEETFKVGDTVRLKSGGPVMTYSGKSAYGGAAICVYFDGKKKLEETFEYETLMKFTSPS